MELENIIIRLDELKEELDTFRPLREDHLHRLRQKLKLDWNFHSNSIEGNTLTLSETKSFLLFGITAKGKPFRDYIEMKGHNDALNKLYQIVNDDLKITESLIKEFHKMILVEPYSDDNAEINPGEWKTLPNYLYSPTNERIDFSPPEEVPELMNSLINWLNNQIAPPKRKKSKYNLHPLLIAAGFHSQFIKIHPFGDGNGRMARILMNLILMLCGYVPAVIKLDNRKDYYTAINSSSIETPENLAIVLGQATIESLEIAIKAAKGESIEEDNDIDKELELLNKKLEAKTIDVPLKSNEVVIAILKDITFPFFDKIVQNLSKFESFFESRHFFISPNDIKRIFSSEIGGPKLNNINIVSLPDIKLDYMLNLMKSTSKDISIEFFFQFRFNRSEYIISDNLTNKKQKLRYNEFLSIKEQNDWIKAIQNKILEQLKKEV